MIYTIILIALSLLGWSFSFWLSYKNRKLIEANGTRQFQITQTEMLKEKYLEYAEQSNQLIRDITENKIQQAALIEQIKSGRELVSKELELEREKQKKAHEEWLTAELSRLNEESNIDNIKKEIDNYRRALQILQEQEKQNEDLETKLSRFSIQLSKEDKEDMELFREISNRLNKKSLVGNIIWVNFIQKPLQVVRKNLNADKISGIYRIYSKTENKSYIGQSTDIGNRFTEHAKDALGVNGLGLLSKFHKALRKDGIDNFIFEVIEALPNKEDMNKQERYWIEFYDSVNSGYNTLPGVK